MLLNHCRQPARAALVAVLLAAASSAMAENAAPDRYVRCSFYPQGKGCDQTYQLALRDPSPGAASVPDAFEHYARYLKPASEGLTEDDKLYLKQNEIRVPSDLEAADLAGLHNVIHDPILVGNEAAKRTAVNAFIARAVQAELYCGISECRDDGAAPST